MYNNWKNVWANSPYSNPNQIANCDEYRQLYSLCSENKELVYCIYKVLENGDVCAVKLLEDLVSTNTEAQETIQSIKSRNQKKTRASNGANIIRPLQTNAMLYVKDVLSSETAQTSHEATPKENCISYSNSREFGLSAQNNRISINFSIAEDAEISLCVLDLNGNEVCSVLSNQSLKANQYNYSAPISEKGIYLVRLIVNGRTNVKKVSL